MEKLTPFILSSQDLGFLTSLNPDMGLTTHWMVIALVGQITCCLLGILVLTNNGGKSVFSFVFFLAEYVSSLESLIDELAATKVSLVVQVSLP